MNTSRNDSPFEFCRHGEEIVTAGARGPVTEVGYIYVF